MDLLTDSESLSTLTDSQMVIANKVQKDTFDLLGDISVYSEVNRDYGSKVNSLTTGTLTRTSTTDIPNIIDRSEPINTADFLTRQDKSSVTSNINNNNNSTENNMFSFNDLIDNVEDLSSNKSKFFMHFF